MLGHIVTLWASVSGLDFKEYACNARDPGSIPGLGRSPGEGNGDPLQYSCLENSMDRGAWRATVYGLPIVDMTERLTHASFHLACCLYTFPYHISVMLVFRAVLHSGLVVNVCFN